jgi:type I restriction enzyme S subunit
MKAQEMKKKEGFKETILGWIPEDWEVIEIKDVLTIGSGKDYKHLKKGSIPVFGSGGIMTFVDKYLYDGESVGIGRKGTIDKPVLLDGKFWTVDTLFYTHSFKGTIPKFVFNVFLTIPWKRYNAASSIPSLSKTTIDNIKIKLPPLSEQKAIANCLSTWDTAITKQDALIKEKKQLKTGLMQQLLSGKKRLSGFNGEWDEKRVDDFANEHSQKNVKNEDIEVLSCTKYDGLVPSLQYFGRQVFGDDLSKYKIVPRGYFAYATNHIEEGSIGYQDFNKSGLVSPMYTVFKTDETIDDIYLFKVLKSHKLIHEYNRRMEGSIDRRGGLRWKNFRGIKLSIPSKEEQTAIAQVLNTADQEISLLTNQRNQLQLQKKGLMQQLLTGKKRLKI